jgi:hypothetical protein
MVTALAEHFKSSKNTEDSTPEEPHAQPQAQPRQETEKEKAPHEDIISPALEGLHVRTGPHQVQGQVEQPDQ